MSHAMEVLALLDERPFAEQELAGVLARPLVDIQATLTALRQAGTVKTVGSAKKWTLITTAPAPAGRPVTETSRDSEMLALLKDGPRSPGELGDAMRLSHSPIFRRLQKLRTQGKVQSFGRGRFTQWALPEYVVPIEKLRAAQGPAAKAAGAKLPSEPGWWTVYAAPGSDRGAFNAELERRHQARLRAQAGMRETAPVVDDSVPEPSDTPSPDDLEASGHE